MRGYILTDREREIIETFLNDGVKLNGFSVLVLRLKKAQPRLKKDFELFNSVLKKIEPEREK